VSPRPVPDIAAYPWIVPHERQGQDLGEFPHLRRWFEAVRERPATGRAYARGREVSTRAVVNEDSRRHLFGQTARSVRR
jgi:GST-like protein